MTSIGAIVLSIVILEPIKKITIAYSSFVMKQIVLIGTDSV